MGKRSACCVPGCNGNSHHRFRFPHPVTDAHNRFGLWLRLINRKVLGDLDSKMVYGNRRVCGKHFSQCHFIPGTEKLKKNAVPDLNLRDEILAKESENHVQPETSSVQEKNSCQPCKDPTLIALLGRHTATSCYNNRICSEFKHKDYQNDLQIKVLERANPTLSGTKDVADNAKCSTGNKLGVSHPELICSRNGNLIERSETVVPSERRTFNYRWEADPSHMIEETPELYSFIVLPYLDEENIDMKWVYNIISGTSGQDRVVYESPCKDDKDGFLLIRDLEWDGIALENLHLLAIPYRPGILSLRDLRVNHLPLLRNIHIQGRKAVEDKYGLPVSQLSIFLRYQPSFYHLHIHFTSLSHNAWIHAGNSHLLSCVINNLEKYPDYYQDATLPFCLKESDKLFLQFEKHGISRKLHSSVQ